MLFGKYAFDFERDTADCTYRSIFEPASPAVEHPVLQCVQIKTMEPKAGDANPVQRFRVVLSDIRNFIQTMVATGMFANLRALTILIVSRNQ